MKFHGRLCGMSPQRKDASTFVLIFCTLFILHNILIHLFDFCNNSVKLDKSHTNKGVLANHRHAMQTGRRQDGQRGQRDRELARLRLTRCDGRRHSVWSVRVTSGFLFPALCDLFARRGRRAEEPSNRKGVEGGDHRVAGGTGFEWSEDKGAGHCEVLDGAAADGLSPRRSRVRGVRQVE